MIQLKEVDQLEVVVLVENYTDLFLMVDHGIMKRPPLQASPTPLAEHGLSLLIKVRKGNDEQAMLMDTGMTPAVLLNNMTLYNVEIAKIECVMLSHGHLDHFGGLMGYLENAPKGQQLIAHPDAFLPRRLNLPDCGPMPVMPMINETELIDAGVVLHKVTGPRTWCSDMIMNLGEVERLTDFEDDFVWAEIQRDNSWTMDLIKDDQGIAVNVKDKGLVIIGGCSHSGIINTVHHAINISGVSKVHAVLGGFHLTGPLFEPQIDQTVEEMKRIEPDYILPMHCTGWKAINAFANAMPDNFYLTSVGTRYFF